MARSHHTETHKDSAMAGFDWEKGHISIGCSRRDVDSRGFGKMLLLLTCNDGGEIFDGGAGQFSVFLFFLCFFCFFFTLSIHSTLHQFTPTHLLQKDMIYLKGITATDARLFTYGG